MSAEIGIKINQQLSELKAKAAEINASLASGELDFNTKRGLKKEYMQVASQIAQLKRDKTAIQLDNKKAAEDKPNLRVANLYFPKEQRVQYFVTELNMTELLLLLQSVFENELPAVMSFFSVDESRIDKLPKEWYELVSEDDEKTE